MVSSTRNSVGHQTVCNWRRSMEFRLYICRNGITNTAKMLKISSCPLNITILFFFCFASVSYHRYYGSHYSLATVKLINCTKFSKLWARQTSKVGRAFQIYHSSAHAFQIGKHKCYRIQ